MDPAALKASHFIPLWAVKWAATTRPPKDLEAALGAMRVCAVSSSDPTVGRHDARSIDAFNTHCRVQVDLASRRMQMH